MLIDGQPCENTYVCVHVCQIIIIINLIISRQNKVKSLKNNREKPNSFHHEQVERVTEKSTLLHMCVSTKAKAPHVCLYKTYPN